MVVPVQAPRLVEMGLVMVGPPRERKALPMGPPFGCGSANSLLPSDQSRPHPLPKGLRPQRAKGRVVEVMERLELQQKRNKR